MSPYRVLVTSDPSDPDAAVVLSAMLHRDTIGNRKIYIMRKILPQWMTKYADPDQVYNIIAHMYSTDKNSIHIDRYDVLKEGKHDYTLQHDPTHNIVIVHEAKLATCLKLAMEHYCSQNNLKIIQKL